jgi:hypothetical protein
MNQWFFANLHIMKIIESDAYKILKREFVYQRGLRYKK